MNIQRSLNERSKKGATMARMNRVMNEVEESSPLTDVGLADVLTDVLTDVSFFESREVISLVLVRDLVRDLDVERADAVALTIHHF